MPGRRQAPGASPSRPDSILGESERGRQPPLHSPLLPGGWAADSLPVPTRGSAPGNRAQAPGTLSSWSLGSGSRGCETLATAHPPGKTRQESGPLGDQGRAGCGQGRGAQRPWVCDHFHDLRHPRVKMEATVPLRLPPIWRCEFAGGVSMGAGTPRHHSEDPHRPFGLSGHRPLHCLPSWWWVMLAPTLPPGASLPPRRGNGAPALGPKALPPA